MIVAMGLPEAAKKLTRPGESLDTWPDGGFCGAICLTPANAIGGAERHPGKVGKAAREHYSRI